MLHNYHDIKIKKDFKDFSLYLKNSLVNTDEFRYGRCAIRWISLIILQYLQVWTQKCAVQKASVDVNISYY